ncbi:MAG TPA: MauE/DoxX family redox-associated membrane protein [Solirubrobacteraceae bacterium]|jgi:hypothetical protein|nr:MauE/DoxX family redox-associated membrane protein [Solirubrobacteraceae bacterium]
MGGLEHLIEGAGDAIAGFPGSPAHALALAALATVFVWSGVAKVRRPWLTAMAIVDFGVGDRPRPQLGRAVAWGELALGAAFIAALWASPWFGVVAGAIAIAVLATFAWFIARALRSGLSFACFCFGDPGDRVSRATLARTSALAVLAGGVAIAGVDPASGFSGEEATLGMVAGAGAVGCSTLASRAATIWRLPRPPAGSAATLVGPAE